MRASLVSGEWIDISLPLRNGMIAWPGDAPFDLKYTHEIARGGPCNLSQISTTAHIGTHMDAPRHYLDGAAGMETMPVEATVGRARVIEIHDPELIRTTELEGHRIAKGERVLFKTGNSRQRLMEREFQQNYVSIAPEAAKYLVERGARTVGTDYLSVGGFEEDGAETHRILLSAGIWIIEGLDLEHVAPGDYELVCLPLKILGGDGAPARAVLRKLVL